MSVDFAKMQELFLAAVEHRGLEDQKSFLDQACAGDDEMRRQVDLLLKAHHEAGSVPGLATEDGRTGAYDARTETPGTAVGPYKLLELIGEGGMGTVWMAQQTEPVKRLVALKLIKAGMDSKQVIARFEAERQALALMDHPNIAKVFDGGCTPAGRPYFVMELVKGVSITKYCDEHRLTPRERLELLLPVCQAIQHAHQKGIIHRDIKPSNVLVAPYDGKPVPKVIDFGVAKAAGQSLTERTLVTGFGAIVGTLEYMSPEQAELNNQDIDTRSDIYSLGVLLYELLTGTTPLDRQQLKKAAFNEMLRIIREEEPPRPSTRLSESKESLPSISAQRHTEPAKLTKVVRGELDWIVMKALEKDRSRRYETANGFALDIQHYLNDEQVQACPPSVGYRLRKYFSKHRVGLLTAAVIVLALVTGTAVSTWQAIRATRAVVAERAALGEATKAQKEEAAQRREAVAAQKAAEEARGKAVLEQKRAEEALNSATVEQKRAEDNLDLALKALDAVYLDAIGQDKLLGPPLLLADDPNYVPRVYTPLTEMEKELLKRGLSFYDQFARQNTGTPQAAMRSGMAYLRAGQIRAALGDRKAAHSAFLTAIERFEPLLAQDQTKLECLANLGHCQAALARTISDWNAAKPHLQQALQYYSRAIECQPKTAWLYSCRAWVHAQLSDYAEGSKDVAQAALFDPDNHWTQVLAALNIWFIDLARARPFAERAMELKPKHPMSLVAMAMTYESKDPERLKYLSKAIELGPEEGAAYERRAIFHQLAGDYERARVDIDKAVKLMPAGEWAKVVRAEVYLGLKRYDEVEHQLQQLLKENPNLARAHGIYGQMYFEQKHYAKANESLTRSLAIGPRNWHHRQYRVKTRFYLGLYLDVLTDLREAFDLKPDDPSIVTWIPLADIARCPSEELKWGLSKLADDAVVHPQAHQGEAHLYRGLLRAALGRLDDAEADFAVAAAKTEPAYKGYTRIWGRLLQRYSNQNKLDDFIKLASPGLTEKAETASLWNWRGLAYHRLGNHEAALVDFDKAVGLDPKQLAVHNNRAAVLLQLARWGDAAEAMAKTTELKATDWLRDSQLALCWLGAGDQPKYRAACAAMLRRYADTTDPEIADRCAWTCALAPAAVPNHESALALAKRAVKAQPKNSQFRTTLAALLYRSGQAKEALNKLTELVDQKLLPTSSVTSLAYPRFFQAMAYHMSGDTVRARESLRTALAEMERELGSPSRTAPWSRRLSLELLRNEAEALLGVVPKRKEP